MTLKYTGHLQREALYDVTPVESTTDTAILFIHGYMGYKDWGAWNWMSNQLIKTGFPVYKINLSHNGTTLDKPTEFADLEAFKNGGYWADFNDISLFMDHLQKENNIEKFILIGHSRGGGEICLFAKDPRVIQLHAVSPISSIENKFPKGKELDKWETEGVYYRENSRTHQSLPHSYRQYEDFLEHQTDLNIEAALHFNKTPLFVYHGDQDTSVPLAEGVRVAQYGRGIYQNIQGANHTFGISEPWTQTQVSEHFEILVNLIAKNIQNC
jgi:Dipeptidyl aminopeptidases/acylaminoacyl-peptidases